MPKCDTLISTRVSRCPYVVPGSVKVKCSICGELVWLSPSSLSFLHSDPEIETLCMECGSKRVEAKPGEIQPPTPAQLDEIKEYLKRQ